MAELTSLVDLSAWPEGSRVWVRAERPIPAPSSALFDIAEGFRHTACITDAGPGAIPGQVAGLELGQHQHARTEDRIRQAKAAGLRNLPCRAAPENHAWLEGVLAAADLEQLVGGRDGRELAVGPWEMPTCLGRDSESHTASCCYC